MALSAVGVAAALAVLPTQADAPRVIQQFTSVFLVSRYGELWRVYDCEAPDGSTRKMPSPGSTARARAFVALAQKGEVRIFRFGPGEGHDISPHALQQQLDRSIQLEAA
jgi:hypothetical protein